MPMSEYLQALRRKTGPDLLLFVAVCGLIFNEQGHILLQRRSDNGRWALVGGILEPGEEPAAALVREVMEETGMRVEVQRITGVYLSRVIFYPDGNQGQYVVVAFRCRSVSGVPHVADEESLEVGYFPLDALPELHPEQRARIDHAISDAPPYFAKPDGGPT
jgi:8-oxo-dGTP diphosphatase